MERVGLLHPRSAVSSIVRAWDRFWFRPEPTSTLAIVRIAFGVLTVLRTLTLVPDVGAFFGPGGVGAGQRGGGSEDRVPHPAGGRDRPGLPGVALPRRSADMERR